MLGVMKRYIEASSKAKKVFFSVTVIWAGVALLLVGLIGLNGSSRDTPPLHRELGPYIILC